MNPKIGQRWFWDDCDWSKVLEVLSLEGKESAICKAVWKKTDHLSSDQRWNFGDNWSSKLKLLPNQNTPMTKKQL